MLDKEKPILIVDDIQPARETLINILSVLGFKNFLEAENGEEACEIIKNNKNIQLIISDWKMPKMDGLSLLKWIRNNSPVQDIPFVMLTSKGEKEDIALAAELDVTAYLLKPISVDDIISKLKEIQQRQSVQKSLDNHFNDIKNLIEKEKFEEAEELSKKVLSQYPEKKVKILYELAKIYFQHNMLDVAEEMINRCIGENSIFEKAWILKSDIHLKKADYNSAISSLKRVFELNPKSSNVLFKIGKIYLMRGKLDKARDYFYMAYKEEPNNLNLIQNIWNIYLEKGLVKQVLLDFKHILYKHLTLETLNNLAVSLRKEGMIEEAIDAYKQALTKDPKNDKIHYNLAVAYLNTNKKKKALDHLLKAIEINPEFEKAHVLIKKLTQESEKKKD